MAHESWVVAAVEAIKTPLGILGAAILTVLGGVYWGPNGRSKDVVKLLQKQVGQLTDEIGTLKTSVIARDARIVELTEGIAEARLHTIKCESRLEQMSADYRSLLGRIEAYEAWMRESRSAPSSS